MADVAGNLYDVNAVPHLPDGRLIWLPRPGGGAIGAAAATAYGYAEGRC